MTSTNSSWGSAFRPETKPMTFIAGAYGTWKIESIVNIACETLPGAERLDVRAGLIARPNCAWALSGVGGHARYVERRERGPLMRSRHLSTGRKRPKRLSSRCESRPDGGCSHKTSGAPSLRNAPIISNSA